MTRLADSPYKKSLELFYRACETIPLGTQTFSKSYMSTVFGASPLFVERGNGAWVWDVDGNRYVDCVMGLLPIVLGYKDPDVDAAILSQLEKGITFSLATDLEARLAELVCELIPCSEMVRFGKNGSDATTAAIRLARHYTKRDKIAVCGYHGWHDWYIGTTSRDSGVPDAVKSLTQKFLFNDLESLHSLVSKQPDQFAAIILEPMAFDEPETEFLQGLRNLCDQQGIVLIFDEIITGFRIDLGGAQKKFSITPDLATFGKAMGNGMPISAVTGRANIMEGMKEIFFSGTFGGETLSLAASIATIEKLKRLDVPSRLNAFGAKLQSEINLLITKHSLEDVIKIDGGSWWPRINIVSDASASKTLIFSLLKQELLRHGVLAGGSLNFALAHEQLDVQKFLLEGWESSLGWLSHAVETEKPEQLLRGELIKPIFKVR